MNTPKPYEEMSLHELQELREALRRQYYAGLSHIDNELLRRNGSEIPAPPGYKWTLRKDK